jgi:hypothetical protein
MLAVSFGDAQGLAEFSHFGNAQAALFLFPSNLARAYCRI